jgi:RNAse (barnase) inhibitor barstar
MIELASLLAGEHGSGLYEWSGAAGPDEVRDAVERAGRRFVHLDTAGVEDKQGFLDRAATAFGFPDWFGRNWDALADSLADVRSATGVVVLWDGWQAFADRDQRSFAVAVDILRQRAQSELDGAFVVLVHHAAD